MSTTTTPIDNGVNVEALLGARDAFAENPEIAQFQWRSSVTWENGTHSRSEIESFYGFAEEQAHHESFSLDTDHPLQFASEDKAPTPVEYVLVGLGGCLTAGSQPWPSSGRSSCARSRPPVGRHGPARHPRGGPRRPERLQRRQGRLRDRRGRVADDIRRIVAQSQKRSAVFDIVTNPTDVTVTVV